jgi:uncharacterized protein YcbK (DUF882 family)
MTIKQRQCLLAYLGYYVGEIDGKWGQMSKVACKAFQKDFGGIAVDGVCGAETEKALKHAVSYGFLRREEKKEEKKEEPADFGDGIKHFKRSEFACKCGKYCNGFPVEPDEKLVALLEKIREHFGKPVRVNSGIRCSQHNKNCGGAKSSQHLYGTAADIAVEGVAPAKVADYAETLLVGTGGIGRYGTFTHVDVRPNKSRWNG